MFHYKLFVKLANRLDEMGYHDLADFIDAKLITADLQVEMEKEVKEKGDEDEKDDEGEIVDVSKKKKITLKFD